LKYLDAVFDRVEVKNAAGRWVKVEKGSDVIVNGSRSVRARITVTNLGEAQWVAGKQAGPLEVGVVRLLGVIAQPPLPQDTMRFGAATFRNVRLTAQPVKEPKKITLQLDATDRAPFGERFEFILVPT